MATIQLQISRFAQGRQFSRTAFEIIDQLLNQSPPTASPESAARKVNELYLEHEAKSQGDEQQILDAAGTFLYEFWDLVFNTAGQFRHDRPEQNTLAEFIGQLQQIDVSRQVNGAKLWKELPRMTLVAREAMNNFHQNNAAKRNFMAFVARLTAKEICDFSLWAIWDFRDVLEDEPDSRSRAYQLQGPWLDIRIPFTAQWITLAGPILLQNSIDRKYLDNGADGGRLWKKLNGFEGLCPERWNFWRERFGDIARSLQVNAETRRIAGETEMWMKDSGDFGT